jgi:hypothetical protein
MNTVIRNGIEGFRDPSTRNQTLRDPVKDSNRRGQKVEALLNNNKNTHNSNNYNNKNVKEQQQQ